MKIDGAQETNQSRLGMIARLAKNVLDITTATTDESIICKPKDNAGREKHSDAMDNIVNTEIKKKFKL